VVKYGVTCVQSIDSLELLDRLDSRFQAEGCSIDVMVQVNTSFEQSKYGLTTADVTSFLKELNRRTALRLKGFMTVGLFDNDETAVRLSYSRLRQIRDRAIADGLISPDADELSMGMSNDLEMAILEGATMVRVGSAIFGARNYLISQ
jgi:pyridoxal phosphate enzyme (YggS family)